MLAAIGKLRSAGIPLIICSYVAAVITLMGLTNNGPLGGPGYGAMVTRVLAFPLSLALGVLGLPQDGILGEVEVDGVYYQNYASAWEQCWPGLVNAAILAVLLLWRRTRTAGLVMGWVVAAAVILMGIGIIISSSAGRLYGLIFLLYGSIMIIGLIARLGKFAPTAANPSAQPA